MNNNGIIDEYIEYMGRPVKALTHKRKARFILSKDVESNQDEVLVKANPVLLKKRGGPQPGSGRPPKDPKDKVVKCYISMTQAHHAATEGDRSRIIRRALEFEAKYKDIVEDVVKAALANNILVERQIQGYRLECKITLVTADDSLVAKIGQILWPKESRT